MAKKKLEIKETHTCGECRFGVPDMDHSNLDMQGKPICVVCPYDKKRERIRSEKACDKWKPKQKK